jgi:AraC-like DNA-binding protein
MLLQIRNMESDRCKTLVKEELQKLGIKYKRVILGEVELKENITEDKLHLIGLALRNTGLELIRDKKKTIIEKIKAAVYQLVYLSDDSSKQKFSDFISKKVYYDYTSLSNLFSGIQGITIEKYVISQKIERVKEMLIYQHLSISEIAYLLRYSSVAHLSGQFKKVTGITPSSFKQRRLSKYGEVSINGSVPN